MRTMCYRIGNWRAEARVDMVQADRLLAVVSVTSGSNAALGASRHTVVFEHRNDRDPDSETEDMMRRLLHARYGS